MWCWDQIQGLMHARQMLYQVRYNPSLKFISYKQDKLLFEGRIRARLLKETEGGVILGAERLNRTEIWQTNKIRNLNINWKC